MAIRDLDALLVSIWAELAQSVGDRLSPWRTPVLATTAPDGQPTARVVVLRRVVAETAQLSVHTDARSQKMAGLAAEPRASLVFWRPDNGVQIRAEGVMRARPRDHPETVEAWRSTPPLARSNYGAAPAPGAPIRAPEEMRDAPDETASRTQFRVLVLDVRRIDWLDLSDLPHRRAEFIWSANGVPERAQWLAP